MPAERLYRIHRTSEIPVRELAEEAHASRSSFYARFPDADALAHIVYDRFCKRTLAVASEVDVDWERGRPGGDDFAAFVSFMLGRYVEFWRAEQRLIQAFRIGEVRDPALRGKRQWLDGEILRRVIRVGCRHYEQLDGPALEKQLEEGLAIIAAAFRGGSESEDQLGLATPDAHDRIVEGLTELVLRFVPRAREPQSAQPQPRAQSCRAARRA